MSYSSERTAIESRFSSMYTASDIKWENVDYKATPGRSFVELIIDTDDSDQREITSNNPTYRTTGSIVCIIYTAVNAGSKAARTIMDSIRSIFCGQQFNGITCRGATIGKGGVKEEWYRTVMNIEFFYDERLA